MIAQTATIAPRQHRPRNPGPTRLTPRHAKGAGEPETSGPWAPARLGPPRSHRARGGDSERSTAFVRYSENRRQPLRDNYTVHGRRTGPPAGRGHRRTRWTFESRVVSWPAIDGRAFRGLGCGTCVPPPTALPEGLHHTRSRSGGGCRRSADWSACFVASSAPMTPGGGRCRRDAPRARRDHPHPRRPSHGGPVSLHRPRRRPVPPRESRRPRRDGVHRAVRVRRRASRGDEPHPRGAGHWGEGRAQRTAREE